MKAHLKFRHFVFASALVALAACSSNPTHPVPAAPSGAAHVTDLGERTILWKEGDRLPAQAPSLTWNQATVSVRFTANDNSSSVQVPVEQEMTWYESEDVTEIEQQWRDVQVSGTCYEMVCSAGQGRSELWDAFYSAQGHAKIKALENAIKGIGEVSARKLVAAGYFQNRKPRRWSEFVADITRAADRNVIKQSVRVQVLETYRLENIVNLGYGPNACQERGYACTKWIEKLVPVPVTRTVQVKKRKVHDRRVFDLSIRIDGAKLLPGEQELVTLSVNENGQVTIRDDGKFNRYALSSSVSGRNVTVLLTGTQRYLRDLPANAIQKDGFELIGKNPTFVLYVDGSYIPNAQQDADSQLVLDYTVKSCKPGWVGACAVIGRSTQTVKMVSMPITQGRTLVELDLPTGLVYWIEYTVSRRNSSFFSDKATNTRQTETLRLR